MEIFKQLMRLKEHLAIWAFVIVLSILMLVVQHYASGLTKVFWLSLIPSIIIDSLFILIASYFIAYLLKKNEDSRVKIKVFKMLGKRYEKMIVNLGKDYITFLTKNSIEIADDVNNKVDIKRQLQELYTNTQSYVKSDFLKVGFEVNVVDNSIKTGNIFDNVKKTYLSVQQFTYYFKQKNSQEIDSFVSKYISVLPEELRESLFKVEDTLQSGIFTTGIEFGLPIDTSNAEFSPEEFAFVFKELGEEIYYLMTYFDKIQEVDTSKKFKGGLSRHFTAENLILSLLYLMLIYIIVYFLRM